MGNNGSIGVFIAGWLVLSAKLPLSGTVPHHPVHTGPDRQHPTAPALRSPTTEKKKKKHTPLATSLPPIFPSLGINSYPPEPFSFRLLHSPPFPSSLHPPSSTQIHLFFHSPSHPLNSTRFYCCSFIPLYLTHESATYAHRHLLHLDILSLPPQQTPFFPLFSFLQLSRPAPSSLSAFLYNFLSLLPPPLPAALEIPITPFLPTKCHRVCQSEKPLKW